MSNCPKCGGVQVEESCSDLERFKEFLGRIGIEYKEKSWNTTEEKRLRLYNGSSYDFDKDGNLIR